MSGPHEKKGTKMEQGQTMTLRDVPVGERARVKNMGITKGVEVFVRKVAPLGDPLEVTVRGYELSLRKSEAENVLVERIA